MKTLFAALTLVALVSCGGSDDAKNAATSTDGVSVRATDQADIPPKPAGPQLVKIQPGVDHATLKIDDYGMSQVTYANGIIEMFTEYGGGCETHIFNLVAYNLQFSKESSQVDCILTHNANRDSCEAMVGQHLRFDLKPIITANQNSPAAKTGKPIKLNIFGPHMKEPASTLSIAIE